MWSKYGAQVHLGEEEHVHHKWECDKNMCTNKQTNYENNKKKNICTNESTKSDQKSKTSQERNTALTSQY